MSKSKRRKEELSLERGRDLRGGSEGRKKEGRIREKKGKSERMTLHQSGNTLSKAV